MRITAAIHSLLSVSLWLSVFGLGVGDVLALSRWGEEVNRAQQLPTVLGRV